MGRRRGRRKGDSRNRARGRIGPTAGHLSSGPVTYKCQCAWLGPPGQAEEG